MNLAFLPVTPCKRITPCCTTPRGDWMEKGDVTVATCGLPARAWPVCCCAVGFGCGTVRSLPRCRPGVTFGHWQANLNGFCWIDATGGSLSGNSAPGVSDPLTLKLNLTDCCIGSSSVSVTASWLISCPQ